MRVYLLATVLICVTTLGCGESKPKPLPGPAPPLTVADWKVLPVEEKYDEATFERLRKQDPKLNTPREWDRFMMEVVMPERRQDIPQEAPGGTGG